MSVSLEYVTDLRRVHTAGEGQFFLVLSFSFPFPLFYFFNRGRGNHFIICIDNYQRQTPCKQIGQAQPVLKQQRYLCGHTRTSQWATATLSNIATTHSTSIQCGQPVTYVCLHACVCILVGSMYTCGSTAPSLLHGSIYLDACGGSAALEQGGRSQPKRGPTHEVLLSHRLG